MLAVARDEFVARGHQGASIEGIDARVGVTRAAVYYWFSDKEDLAGDLQRVL